MDGWIKVHRKMLENEIVCKDADHLAVWIYLLLNATHKAYQTYFGNGIVTLNPGELKTGRKAIATALGIKETKVERILKLLENAQQIGQQTNSRGRVISILNWHEYQKIEQQVDNERTASRQQTDTNKNVKNDKNERNKRYAQEAEKLWSLYPNKKGKEAAMRKMPKIIEQYGYDVIEACIEKYAKEVEGKDMKYVKHGSTFFNGAFTDYLEVARHEETWEEYLWENPVTGEQEIRKRKKGEV